MLYHFVLKITEIEQILTPVIDCLQPRAANGMPCRTDYRLQYGSMGEATGKRPSPLWY